MTEREQLIATARVAHSCWLRTMTAQAELLERSKTTEIVGAAGASQGSAFDELKLTLPPDWDRAFPEYAKVIDRNGAVIANG